LVGAGPGDPELLTLKAVRALAEADVVAYDELISEEILDLAPAHAERVPVGRRANGCRHHEGKIHPAVIEAARAGKTVVRLKGGDPMIFGRGGEEAEELAAAGIAFAFVPGVSAALGAAASTGIPLTHREEASSVTFATAHAASGDGDPKLAVTVPLTGTVVLYMGLGRLAETARSLVAAGRRPETPVCVIAHATRPTQRTVTGTLATIAELVAHAELPAPALIVVGEVVGRAVSSPVPLPLAAGA
jgi:uroporphyrin-III C-methyltransferase/precorrin-2 dehydrogenase/sirohydrochlorin ferrochelatase